MKIITKVTLRGMVDGEYCHWPSGSLFDDEIHPIPEDILTELEQKTGTVEEIGQSKVGGSARKKASPKVAKPKTKTSSSDSNKKTKPKTKTKKSKRKKL